MNRCVILSSLESVGAPGAEVPLSVEPILLYMEGGWYVVPLLPGPLADLVRRRHGGGGISSGVNGGVTRGGKGGGKGLVRSGMIGSRGVGGVVRVR